MYLNSRTRLGNDLTDNSYDDDGYRYHDVLHLANVAKLGWSPVLRGLMKRKRKLDPLIDEVEDGARAQIVEEAVIKAIHGEGERLASLRYGPSQSGPERLFASASDISFSFLKFVTNFVSDLEVEKNKYWEWEAAIVEGYGLLHRLHCEGQGTISIDLQARTVSFGPDVFLDVAGGVAGMGTARGEVGDMEEVRKRAILDSLGLIGRLDLSAQLHVVQQASTGLLSVKAEEDVRRAMWDRRVMTFRTSSIVTDGEVAVTALALSPD